MKETGQPLVSHQTNNSKYNKGFLESEVTKKSIATYLRVIEYAKVFPSEFEDIFGKWILRHTFGYKNE
jgi:hypothetical protein